MSRLIDAELLEEILDVNIQKLQDDIDEARTEVQKVVYEAQEFSTMEIIKLIREQPTVFDVDKVVEQLEKLSTIHYSRFDDYMKQGNKELAYKHLRAFNAYHKSIEIVKAGGIDEDR